MTTKTKAKCPYADKCIDEGKSLCSTCVHNEKRSYYKHYDPYPYYPYQPYWPWYEKPYYTEPYYIPPWTVTYGNDTTGVDISYYQSV